MFRQAPSFPYHDLGIVEDGNTASRAISKDAYVIWKGSSYFASTDILQGATLEEDVNLIAIPDGVINGVVEAVNNKLTPIESTTLLVSSVPDRTPKSVCKLSLSAGTWLVFGKVSMVNKASGMRGIAISKIENSFGWISASATGYGSGSDHDLILNGAEIIVNTSTEYVYLNAYVAISASNNITGSGNTKIWAIKLAD